MIEYLTYIGANNAHKKLKSQIVYEKILFMMVHLDQNDLLANFQRYIDDFFNQNPTDFEVLIMSTKAIPKGEDVEGIFVSKKEANYVSEEPDLFFMQIRHKTFAECQRIFEAYLYDLYGEVCAKNPSHLRTEKQITIKEVLRGMENNNLLEVLAEHMANDLFKGALPNVLKAFEELGLPVIPPLQDGTTAADQAGIVKDLSFLWQARNVIQHNNGKIDAKFLKEYPVTGQNLGDIIDLDDARLSSIVRLIEKLAYSLNTRAVAKFGI